MSYPNTVQKLFVITDLRTGISSTPIFVTELSHLLDILTVESCLTVIKDSLGEFNLSYIGVYVPETADIQVLNTPRICGSLDFLLTESGLNVLETVVNG